jgi:hypothetical protein
VQRARTFILVLVLLALASVPTAAAPLHAAPLRDFVADPCPPGTAFHPACDVDDDGVIDIDDIMRTASRWLSSGPATSDNNHTHLGQTWAGDPNPLKLSGAFGAPDYAPLVLSNSSGAGLRVAAASAAAIQVLQTGSDGLYVHAAGDDGVHVNSAAGNGVLVDATSLNGFYVQDATYDGFLVLDAGHYGLRVNQSDWDGVAVIATNGDGVDVNAATDNGIEAAGANRAGYFEGDVEVTGECINCRIVRMAVNTGEDALQPGDVVAVDGVADSPFANLAMLLQVRRAAPGSALLGVVSSRAEPFASPENDGVTLVRRAGQPAAPGDYLAVVIYGPAQVQAGAGIQAGQRVTLGAAGVRALRRVTVEGVTLDEGGASLGIALEAAQDGLAWVLVNPQ